MSYLTLKIFKQGQLLKTKIFTDDQISIGSSEGLNLQLEGVAPWHVLIEKKHDIFCILDLNSETGTKVNGKEVTDETPLDSGAVIEMGPYEIQFFIGPPKEKGKAQSSKEKKTKEKKGAVKSEDSKPSSKKAAKKKSPVPSLSSASKRPAKPRKKGFWNTYAPGSQIENLDEFIEPSIGNLIEVLVCWKERVLSTHHFSKKGLVFLGSGKNCQVRFPNMLSRQAYKLLHISSGAKVYLTSGVKGALFQGKDKKTRTSHSLTGEQTVVLKPYEMVRLDFNPSLRIYVRLTGKTSPPPFIGILNLRLSEAMALFLAFLMTGLLIFYGSLYAPVFLAEDTKFVEKDIRVAKVIFKNAPKAPIVEYELGEKTTKAQVKKPKVVKKRPAIKVAKKPKPKQVKKLRTPRKTRPGKIAGQAPGKKRTSKPKVSVGSVRPGGSLKTGKQGSSAKTKAPDPTKVGLLGAFGGGGKLSELDKGATGKGGTLGLAEQATGYAGTEESYAGEGVGTKTKDLGSGGKGTALVGASEIKTSGKGLSRAGTGTGGLGKRGDFQMEFGAEDIDVAGTIDRNAILEVLRRNYSLFARCYQRALNDKPSIQGNLKMQWLITPSGKGRQAKAINNQIGSEVLANCVVDVLERLNFPEPPSGQTPKVTYTFRFHL